MSGVPSRGSSGPGERSTDSPPQVAHGGPPQAPPTVPPGIPPGAGTPADPAASKEPSVARGGAAMASGSLASRILGLVRNSLIVALFADSIPGNAWQVANTLPTTVYTLMAGGMVNAVLVPQITRAARQPDGGRDFIDRLLTVSFLGLLGVTALSLPLAPVFVRLFSSPDWSPETFELSVQFTRVVLPAVFFYGLYAILGQVLSARNRFGAYGWAPALANIVWIVGLSAYFVMYRGLGQSVGDWTRPMILLLGGSLTVGVSLQALVLLIPLYRDGWRYHPRFGFRGVGLGTAGRVAGWTLAGIAVTQGALALASQTLSSSQTGEVGRLGYDSAFFLFATPHGLITVSLVTALFTVMSRSAARRDLVVLRGQVRHGLRLLAVTTIPTTIAGVCLAKAGTAVIFAANTERVTTGIAWVFTILVVALLPYGILFLVQRTFYAFEDAKTPFYLSLIAAVVFSAGSVASLLLASPHRAYGVALAAGLSDVVAAWVGVRWMRGRLGGIRLREVGDVATRTLFASLVAGLWTLAVVWAFQTVLPGRVGALLTLLVGGAVFVGVFLAGARWLRIGEVDEVIAPIARRLRR